MTSYSWTPLEEKGPPPEVKRRRSMRLNRVLVQHVGIALLVSLLLVAVFAAAGMSPRPLWFVTAALAIGFGSLAVRLVGPQVLETSWPGRQDERRGARVGGRSGPGGRDERGASLRSRSNDNRTQFIATWLQESSRERRAGEGSQT